MSVQSDPIPPVPEHTPPLKEDEVSRVNGKFFNQTWTRWFVSLRDKVNVISASLVNLIDVNSDGFLVKNGDVWTTVPVEDVQTAIQFQDEGVDLGLPDITTVDFTGSVTASRAGDVLTVNVGAGGEGGITVTIGDPAGSDLTVGARASAIVPADYTLTGDWYLWCDPSGSIEIDVQVDDFVNIPPTSGDSIVGGNYPAVVAGISNTDDYTGWTDLTINKSQAVTIEIRSVSAVKWFTFTMEAVK